MFPAKTIFDYVRRDEDHRLAFKYLANRVHQQVTRKLTRRYGHENQVDLYDHPEACILTTGQAAAARIAAYTPGDIPPPPKRLRQWTLALRAYALTMDPDAGNLLLTQVDRHGNPGDIPFAPLED